MEHKTSNKQETANSYLGAIRRSFSNYAIFEIQDKGIIKMVFTGDEDKEHSFPTRGEAIEWLVKYADDFRRYFIMEQITVY
jgi:hypothetical protein